MDKVFMVFIAVVIYFSGYFLGKFKTETTYAPQVALLAQELERSTEFLKTTTDTLRVVWQDNKDLRNLCTK